jgi:hypothetical protein
MPLADRARPARVASRPVRQPPAAKPRRQARLANTVLKPVPQAQAARAT